MISLRTTLLGIVCLSASTFSACSLSHPKPPPETQAERIARFDKKYAQLESTPQGVEYSKEVVQEFLNKNIQAFQACVPPDSPLAQPFAVYMIVEPVGDLKSIEFHPETPVTKCLVQHLAHVDLPRPPKELALLEIVVRIDMEFTE